MRNINIKPLVIDNNIYNKYYSEDTPKHIDPYVASKINNLLNPDDYTKEVFRKRYKLNEWPPPNTTLQDDVLRKKLYT